MSAYLATIFPIIVYMIKKIWSTISYFPPTTWFKIEGCSYKASLDIIKGRYHGHKSQVFDLQRDLLARGNAASPGSPPSKEALMR